MKEKTKNTDLAADFMESQAVSSLTLPQIFLDETPDEEHMFDWNGKEVAK